MPLKILAEGCHVVTFPQAPAFPTLRLQLCLEDAGVQLLRLDTLLRFDAVLDALKQRLEGGSLVGQHGLGPAGPINGKLDLEYARANSLLAQTIEVFFVSVEWAFHGGHVAAMPFSRDPGCSATGGLYRLQLLHGA